MNYPEAQKELFQNKDFLSKSNQQFQDIELSQELLINWQKNVHKHQSKFFKGMGKSVKQGSLFTQFEESTNKDLVNPLKLTPLPLSFWRWPKAPHKGPAIYLVMDCTQRSNNHLLLYIGETIAADRRWKGEHDCKAYLSSYSESLVLAGLTAQLSIRFWTDVPQDTTKRRKIEQDLIQLWLPPFNKETRNRWQTPFTAEVS